MRVYCIVDYIPGGTDKPVFLIVGVSVIRSSFGRNHDTVRWTFSTSPQLPTLEFDFDSFIGTLYIWATNTTVNCPVIGRSVFVTVIPPWIAVPSLFDLPLRGLFVKLVFFGQLTREAEVENESATLANGRAVIGVDSWL